MVSVQKVRARYDAAPSKSATLELLVENEKGEKKRTATEGLLWLLRGLEFTCKALQNAQAREGITVNRARVEEMLRVYFDFVDYDPQSYRLIFESDLMADPQIGERFEGFHMRVAQAVGSVLGPNTGMSQDAAVMLSRSLTDMVQTGAGYWSRHRDLISREEAQLLVFRLAWGGIGVLDEDWK